MWEKCPNVRCDPTAKRPISGVNVRMSDLTPWNSLGTGCQRSGNQDRRAGAAARARHGVPAHPSELEQGHRLVRYFFAGSGRRQPVFLRRGGEELELKGRYFVGVNDANAMLVTGLAGLGILHGPAFMVQPHIGAGRLLPMLEDWSAERVPLSIVYAPNRHLGTPVRVFVDWRVDLLRPA
ncbi:MAG TPA: LysR substrate-binding domain-containing protein [Telluria sp.]|nr:LysR substrate-binding domain-containing protein [Telluria sp.]